MKFDIVKEVCIECCENEFALIFNYNKKTNNVKLNNLEDELYLLEKKIRQCKDENLLDNYKILLNNLIAKIEVIINE